MKDLQSIPKTLKEKTKGVNKKQLALKCAPYVIFGYVLNKVSWLYGQQAGDNTLQNEYYGAAEPPVRCGESHLSGLTEPLHFVY